MQHKFSTVIILQFFCIIFWQISYTKAARGYKIAINFQRIEYRTYDAQAVKSFNCSLHRDDFTKNLVLDTDLILAKTVNVIKCVHKLEYIVNGRKIKLHDIEIDICQSLSIRLDSFTFRMIGDEVRRISNLPLHCPLKSNFLYKLRNFTINSKYFPQFLPNMKWSAYFNFSSENGFTIGLDAFGTLVRNKL